MTENSEIYTLTDLAWRPDYGRRMAASALASRPELVKIQPLEQT